MTMGGALDALLIRPLTLVFEMIFALAWRFTDEPGVCIVFLSLAVNLLVLPLYRRADAVQAQEQEREKRLAPWREHIRRTFRGDERTMIEQAYYREAGYKPWHALRGSLPLLLEVPFFIAAYRYLSGLQLLRGASFGPIADLGAPDALLSAGGHAVHVLPVLMTAVNLVSGAVYTRGATKKARAQLFGMALVFLALLYNSPSGLVFYWTLNNVFSLCKNLLGLLPLRGREKPEPEAAPREDRRLFAGAALLLSLLCGLLIPTAVLESSPTEFVVPAHYVNPLLYALGSLLTALGLFLVWSGVFYLLARPKARRIMAVLLAAAALCAAADYLFFGTNLGTLSQKLVFERHPVFGPRERGVNLLALAALALAAVLLARFRPGALRGLLAAMCAGALALSCVNAVRIGRDMRALQPTIREIRESRPRVSLSRTGRNVIVLMMDRAIACYVPYLFNERPELREQFAGFTWYPDALSFGAYTNFGAPALFGGYEYTPEEMNRRADEPLRDKHNEALRVLPALFGENGWGVTVCDAPYANYKVTPDLSIYDDLPYVRRYITMGSMNPDEKREAEELQAVWRRNFLWYGLMKCAPLPLQSFLYANGLYNDVDAQERKAHEDENYRDPYPKQYPPDGPSVAVGIESQYVEAYWALHRMPEITELTDAPRGEFLMMVNDMTHDVMLLKEPEYEVAYRVDNREYDAAHRDRFTVGGRTIRADKSDQMSTYHVNMAAYIELGRWFDWMRENGVYDNTRIILAADHGRGLAQADELLLAGDEGGMEDIMWVNPLLMVKDFGSREFTEDGRFMTNADAPVLAMEGLIENPVNPFTGKAITGEEKLAPELHVFYSGESDVRINNGRTFMPGQWYALTGGSALKPENWRRTEDPLAGK